MECRGIFPTRGSRECEIEGLDDEACLKRVRQCEFRKECCFAVMLENICSFASWYVKEKE